MSPAEIKRLIEEAHPGSRASVEDTGGGNHFQVLVVSKDFEGKKMLEQHRMIYDVLKKSIDNETIHAMALKTMTPEEYERRD